jgi:hypothetical protein
MVNAYDFSGKTGYGIVFIVASLSKPGDYASMFVTIVDMESKKILLSRPLRGKPSGFGIRNYWGHTVYEILNQVKKTEYKNWLTELK